MCVITVKVSFKYASNETYYEYIVLQDYYLGGGIDKVFPKSD
jgi:hypothetical protein